MSADNIKVAIRVRPLIAREIRGSSVSQWKIQEKATIFQVDESGQAVSEVFAFDRIFEPDETNQFIYKTLVESFIKSTLSGVNSTVFAYGQTSSGKTYTMLGDENNPGIMTLAVEDIFSAIEASSDRKYLIRVAYLEIYNEKVIDLLGNPNDKVHVREVGGSVNLINLTEEIVSTPEQVLQLLKVGTANRQFGETNLNERSSRSHTIFKIMLESTDVQDPDSPIQQSTINLVDLAGSERASQTKATGVRLFEGGHINKSLSTLSLVIRQITEGRDFVNFRDCKLTQILRNSLGGNSKTLIIANVTIASVENTLSTLLFAQTAKAIKCKPQINEVLSDAALSKRYALLSNNYKRQLEDQLKTNQDLELDKETKTKTIDHLRKVIQNLEYFANHSYDRSDSGAIPKRRHTICILGRNGNQSLLPIREGVTMESFESTNLEWTTSGDPEITERKHVPEETVSGESPDSTPKGVLRQRLQILQEEHLELVRFTRDEKDVRKQDEETAIRELSVLQRKFEDETRILEMKIAELSSQLSIQSSENELVVAQLKTKFKKREEELVSELDRLKAAKDSTVNSLSPVKLLDDLVDLQHILMRATDEGCQGCENIEMQMKTAMTDWEKEKQALHLCNEILKCDIQKYQSDIDRLNDEISLNTKFNRDMVEDHSNIVEGLKLQIEVLEQNLCKSNIAHEKEIEVFKLRIDDLTRKLCSNEEVRNCMIEEHSTVVEDFKLQIEGLQQKLCECDTVKEKDREVFQLRIDDLNKKLCSNEEVRNCMIEEHSTVVEDFKLQIEVLQQKLCECDTVGKKDREVFQLRIDDLNKQLCSNEEASNRMAFEHKQAVLSFESKIEQLMRKLTQYDCDLQIQAESLNQKHEKVVDDFRSQVKILQNQIDVMNSDRERLISDYNGELKRLKREIEEQANEKQSDQVKFKISRNMVLEHKNTIKHLKGQVSDLEKALHSSNEVKDKMIIDHKNAVEILESQMQSLEKDLNSNATLKLEIERLVAKLKEMSSKYTKMVDTYEIRLSKFQSDLGKQMIMNQDHDKKMANTLSRLQGLELELVQVKQLLEIANLKNAELNKQLQVLEGKRAENDKLRLVIKELQCKIDFFQKEQLEHKENEKNRKIPVADLEFCLKEEQLNKNKSNSEISLLKRSNEVNFKNTGIIVGQGKENSETNCKDCLKYRDHLKEQTKINGFLKETLKKENSKSDSRMTLVEELTKTIDALKKNVEQLNASNLALTVKIHELENANSECVSCAKWRDEAKARKEENASLTRKLVDIQAEYYSQMKTNIKPQKSEFLQFLEDRNDLLQNRNENLSQKLKEMKAQCQALIQAQSQAKTNGTRSSVEAATKEVQCNILDDEYKSLFEKYKLTKQVAIMRKEKIDELTKKLGQ